MKTTLDLVLIALAPGEGFFCQAAAAEMVAAAMGDGWAVVTVPFDSSLVGEVAEEWNIA